MLQCPRPKWAIREVLEKQGRTPTHESIAYNGISAEHDGDHRVVRHSVGQYAAGDAHTNAAETAFSLVKRGMYGVYHNVGKCHLHRYLAEFDFRWHNRHCDDGKRTANTIKAAEDKPLMYREPEAWPSEGMA